MPTWRGTITDRSGSSHFQTGRTRGTMGLWIQKGHDISLNQDTTMELQGDEDDEEGRKEKKL